MPSPSRMPRGGGTLGRRGLVQGVVGSGVLALAGCGIHLEDDAPHVPLVPRRTPIGAETLLLGLLRNSRELAAACATWTTGAQVAQAPTLAAIHARQADVLAALLADAHVPADLVTRATPTPTATPTTTTTPTTTPTPTPTPPPTTSADIAVLERGPLADATALAAAPAPLLPVIAAILAQRYAAADLVGGSPPVVGAAATVGTPASAGPSTGTPTTATQPDPGNWMRKDLLSILAATRSATYGFEVVAAQGDAAGRALGLRTLATLAGIRSAQEAALAFPAPPADLGYRLPFRVTTPALARKLAGRVATGLRAAYGSTLGATAQGADPFLDLVEWLGQVEAVVHDWGGAFVPFPGMTTP